MGKRIASLSACTAPCDSEWQRQDKLEANSESPGVPGPPPNPAREWRDKAGSTGVYILLFKVYHVFFAAYDFIYDSLIYVFVIKSLIMICSCFHILYWSIDLLLLADPWCELVGAHLATTLNGFEPNSTALNKVISCVELCLLIHWRLHSLSDFYL